MKGFALRSAATIVLLTGTMATFSVFGQVTFFVDSLADDSLQVPGDNLCVTDNNECTFRAALEAANNRSDTVTIDFSPDIPWDMTFGRSVISPSSPLPPISNQVIIRGETHPTFNQTTRLPRFQIDGAIAGASPQASGLTLTSGSQGSEVRYIAAYNFTQSGMVLDQTGSVVLEGNYVGLRPGLNASSVVGNGVFGILILSSNQNFIEDNWVGGNNLHGIMIAEESANNVLTGNRVGQRRTTDSIGVGTAGNGDTGIQVNSNAGSGNFIGRCVIVSSMPFIQECRGNVTAANEGTGIRILADGQSVYSNWVGVIPEDPDNQAFGNAGHGILVESDDNVISSGLNIELTANVIGHNSSGIRLDEANNNIIAGSFIGTNSNGDALGNEFWGIALVDGSNNTISSNRVAFNNNSGIRIWTGYNYVIGNEVTNHSSNGIDISNGGQLIEGNIVGNNNNGIAYAHDIDATANGLVTIIDNHVGVRPDGTPIPNSTGILGWEGGFARIGNNEGRGNVIGHNNNGISLISTSDARIQANWIGIMPDGSPAGNGARGIHIGLLPEGAQSNNNRIGYTVQHSIPEDHADSSQALGNIIAYNNVGVYLLSNTSNQSNPHPIDNAIRGNRFHDNATKSIDLGSGGDQIDPGGSETGANRLQNFPQFDTLNTFFNEATGSVEFTYLVNTTSANASYPLLVDFYVADGSSRQGKTFLHTDEYPAGFAAQPKSGSFVPPAGVDLQDAYLVATATDSAGNTSQFSEAVLLTELIDEIFQDRFEED